MPVNAGSCGSARRPGLTRCLDVLRNLGNEGGLALEGALLAQTLPQLEDQPVPVEVAVEVEQKRLDPALAPAVVRIRADRYGRTVLARRARVDPELGHEQLRVEAEIRRREAEGAASCIARHDRAVELGGSPEQARRPIDLAAAQQVADPRRRDALGERDRANVEAQPLELREVADPTATEAEVRPRDHDLRPERPQHGLDELLGAELGYVEPELDHQRLLDAARGQQLEPPLERGEQLDAVAERGSRMRLEGGAGRRQTRGGRGLEHAPVADVDAVEGPDRDRTRALLELRGRPCDLHGPLRPAGRPTRASASSGGIIRSGSASSTRKGPTSVRRSVRQWPPSAVAIARTYVPEPTFRSRRAIPSPYESSSSESTRDRRTGISTSTPRRCSLYARSPSIFTAEAAGIGSSTSPRSPASRRSSSSGPGGSCRSAISPSRSPVSVSAVRSTSVR